MILRIASGSKQFTRAVIVNRLDIPGIKGCQIVERLGMTNLGQQSTQSFLNVWLSTICNGYWS